MVNADLVDNIVLGTGGDTVTIYTTMIDKIYNKILLIITSPQTKGNWGAGPKKSKIKDLLRIELRFDITGYINSADETKLEDLFESGGIFNLTWDSTNYNVNIDKLTISKGPRKGEQDERDVRLTCIVGEDV